MYVATVPNVTIYVPRELAEQVRAHDVPISATCQTALARKVRIAQRRREVAERELHRRSRENPAGNGTGTA